MGTMENTNNGTGADMTVANTIWAQIPITTKMAVGARDAVASADRLHFTISTRNTRILRKFVVILDADDTYTVQLVEISRKTWDTKIVREFSGVYADTLGTLIFDMAAGRV